MRSSDIQGKRVVFVINSSSGGGVEQLADVLGRDLVAAGASNATVCLYSSIGLPNSTKLRGIMTAAWQIFRSRADIIITFQPSSSVVAATMGLLAGCRVRIVHQANMPGATHIVSKTLDRWAGSCGLYSAIIMNSAATENSFASYPGSYRSYFRRIAHGVDFPEPALEATSVKRSFGLPEGVPLLLTCARLSRHKSIETIISAMPQIPKAHLVIAGDGVYGDELMRVTASLGVTDRVHFLGFVEMDKLGDLYGACDLYISCSRWETFGLAAVQAAMQGMPIVASSIPATVEVLSIDGKSPARFVDDWEASSWAAAVTAALSDTSQHAAAKNFADDIRLRYSEGEMLRAYRLMYQALLSEAAKRPEWYIPSKLGHGQPVRHRASL